MDASSVAKRQRAEETAKHLVDIGLRKHLAGEKQHQTVRVAVWTLGYVVLAPIALIMIVLGGIVFSLVLIYSKLMQL